MSFGAITLVSPNSFFFFLNLQTKGDQSTSCFCIIYFWSIMWFPVNHRILHLWPGNTAPPPHLWITYDSKKLASLRKLASISSLSYKFTTQIHSPFKNGFLSNWTTVTWSELFVTFEVWLSDRSSGPGETTSKHNISKTLKCWISNGDCIKTFVVSVPISVSTTLSNVRNILKQLSL